jgi:hypothetical protein
VKSSCRRPCRWHTTIYICRRRAPQRQASICPSNKMTLRWKPMLQRHVSSVFRCLIWML